MKTVFITTILVLFFYGCSSEESRTNSKEIISNESKIVNFKSVDTKSDSTIDYIEHVTTIGLNGVALDIDLSDDGEFAYVAAGDMGLEVLDVSNPYSSKLIGTYSAYSYVNQVEVIEDVAYLSFFAFSWDDYDIVNLFDISKPLDVKYLTFNEGYRGNKKIKLEIADTIYYINKDTLEIIRKSDNSYQANYPLYDPYAIAVYGDYIYVANGKDGVTILKVHYK